MALGVLTLGAVPAEAQIYTWRDANGNLVVSDRPAAGGTLSFRVPSSTAVRATRAPVASRGAFDALIARHAARHQVRADLVRAVIQVESAFDPLARSPKGAMGLMQLMPATAAEMGVSDPYDPDQNIRGGVAYLRRLLDRYDNNEELALAAYNAGPTAVSEYGNAVPPYGETERYVRRIQVLTAVSASTERAVYKTIEIVGGRAVRSYSDRKPASRDFEVVTRQ